MFFPAFDALTNPHPSDSDSEDSSSTTPQAMYASAMRRLTLAGVFAERGSRFSFDASLALHAATPAVEAFYQYFTAQAVVGQEGCTSWVEWDGSERTCDVEVLKRLVSDAGTAGCVRISPTSSALKPTYLTLCINQAEKIKKSLSSSHSTTSTLPHPPSSILPLTQPSSTSPLPHSPPPPPPSERSTRSYTPPGTCNM